MKQIFLHLILVVSFVVNAQNPANIDLALGNNYAAFDFVKTITMQSDGKLLVGGAYYSKDGRLARFNSDGSTDTSFQINSFTKFNSTSIIVLDAIVVQPDGKILVGGGFNQLNGQGGQSVNGIARLNADGTKDTSFMPPVFTSGEGYTSSIALQPDGKIIIGGGFRVVVNGHNQHHACRLNSDGSIDNTFDLGVFGGPPQGTSSVYAVAVQPDGKVLVAGSFSQFNNQSQGTLIRLNPNGTKDTTFDIGTGSPSGFITNNIGVQPDNKILISGGFTSWNGQPKAHLIRLNANGTIDNDFVVEFSVANVSSNGPSDFALQPDGKIVAVGENFQLYGQSNIWRLNSDGSYDSSLVNVDEINTTMAVFVAPDGKILVGGFLMQYASRMRDCFARLNNDGSIDNSFLSQGLNDEVVTMAVQQDGKALLGGNFSSFNAVSQNRIIRVNGNDGTKDTTFSIGTGFNGNVKIILAQPDGKILVGGDFTTYNQQFANHIVRLNQDGAIDPSFSIGTGFNGTVRTMVLQPDGKIIVGGEFTAYMGLAQNYLIRLNINGAKDSTFNVENVLNGKITALLLQENGKIVIGGNFTTFAGSPHRCLVRLNDNGTKDVTFVPFQNNEFLTITNADSVLDLALQSDGKIYIVTKYVPRRLHTDGSIDTTFTVGYQYAKSIAVQENGKVLIGGTFDYFFNNGGYRRGLVRLNTDGTIDTNFDISLDGDMQYGGFYGNSVNYDYGCKEILIQPDNKIWLGGNFFFYRGVTSFAAIRLVGDSVLSDDNFETLATSSITLYPNPVENNLIIKLENDIQIISLDIYDIMGQLILKPLNFENADVSTLSQGLYLVKIQTNNGNSTKKFLKKEK